MRYLGWVNVDTVHKTIEHSTQWGVSIPNSFPMKHLKSRNPALNIPPQEILHHVKLDYKKHCSMPLLSYILTHNEPTLTNTVHVCALDCLFLCAVHTKQGGYECYHIPTHQVIT